MNKLLNELYIDWFSNKHYWFSYNLQTDTYLCDKYSNVKEELEKDSSMMMHSTNTAMSKYIKKDKVEAKEKTDEAVEDE